jgi:hypothetical protein
VLVFDAGKWTPIAMLKETPGFGSSVSFDGLWLVVGRDSPLKLRSPTPSLAATPGAVAASPALNCMALSRAPFQQSQPLCFRGATTLPFDDSHPSVWVSGWRAVWGDGAVFATAMGVEQSDVAASRPLRGTVSFIKVLVRPSVSRVSIVVTNCLQGWAVIVDGMRRNVPQCTPPDARCFGRARVVSLDRCGSGFRTGGALLLPDVTPDVASSWSIVLADGLNASMPLSPLDSVFGWWGATSPMGGVTRRMPTAAGAGASMFVAAGPRAMRNSSLVWSAVGRSPQPPEGACRWVGGDGAGIPLSALSPSNMSARGSPLFSPILLPSTVLLREGVPTVVPVQVSYSLMAAACAPATLVLSQFPAIPGADFRYGSGPVLLLATAQNVTVTAPRDGVVGGVAIPSFARLMVCTVSDDAAINGVCGSSAVVVQDNEVLLNALPSVVSIRPGESASVNVSVSGAATTRTQVFVNASGPVGTTTATIAVGPGVTRTVVLLVALAAEPSSTYDVSFAGSAASSDYGPALQAVVRVVVASPLPSPSTSPSLSASASVSASASASVSASVSSSPSQSSALAPSPSPSASLSASPSVLAPMPSPSASASPLSVATDASPSLSASTSATVSSTPAPSVSSSTSASASPSPSVSPSAVDVTLSLSLRGPSTASLCGNASLTTDIAVTGLSDDRVVSADFRVVSADFVWSAIAGSDAASVLLSTLLAVLGAARGKAAVSLPARLFVTGASYTVTLTATANVTWDSAWTLASATAKRVIAVADVAQPQLELDGPGARTVTASARTVLSVRGALPDCGGGGGGRASGERLVYTWRFVSVTTVPGVATPSYELPLPVIGADALVARSLVLPPGSLRVGGVYTLAVAATVSDSLARSTTVSVVVTVMPSSRGIIAAITGAAADHPTSRDLVLDASSSRDVDDVAVDLMQYAWMCQAEATFGPCAFTTTVAMDRVKLRVPAGSLAPGVYVFSVTASKGVRGALVPRHFRSDVETVRVKVFTPVSESPLVRINEPNEAVATVSAASRVVLRASVVWPLESAQGSLLWSLSVTSPAVDTTLAELLASSAVGTMLSIRAGVLRPAVSYTFSLTAVAPGGASSMASVTVVAMAGPRGGYVVVSPTSGVAMTTVFSIGTLGWIDDSAVWVCSFVRTRVFCTIWREHPVSLVLHRSHALLWWSRTVAGASAVLPLRVPLAERQRRRRPSRAVGAAPVVLRRRRRAAAQRLVCARVLCAAQQRELRARGVREERCRRRVVVVVAAVRRPRGRGCASVGVGAARCHRRERHEPVDGAAA